MSSPTEPSNLRVWDVPTRLFHWALTIAVTVAIATGLWGGDWMRVHGIAGLTIVGLVTFRLVWGVIGSTYARFTSFLPSPSALRAHLQGRWQGVGHNPLGALSVVALLLLLALQAGTGLFGNDEISFSGPLAAKVTDETSAWLTGWHHRLSNLLFVLIGLHVLAIVFYLVFKRDNLVAPMITGRKRIRHRAEPARRGGWLAFSVALAAALAAVYLASAPAWWR